MATYKELHDLHANQALLEKVMAAVAVACDMVRVEDPGTARHTERVVWARQAIKNVDGTARNIMWALMATNRDLDVAQIEGATDAQIQTAVNNVLELLA